MKYQKGSFIVVPNSSIVGIGPGPQALYMWLCKHANNDGDCYPSRTTLAHSMGCSERSVDGYLEELIGLGLVVKEPRYLNNKQTSNSYYLPLGGANSARGVVKSATLASQNLRTELNPVLTQSNELIERVFVSEKTVKEKTDLGGFAEFMDLYPNKKDKASASAEWRKLSKEDRAQALADLPKRIKTDDWTKDGGAYVPLPKNYLRGRRWEDELPTKKTNVFVV